MLAWILLLGLDATSTDVELPHKALVYTTVPVYIPGITILPIPEAGLLFSWFDVGLWAHILYMIGSLAYLADSIYLCIVSNPGYADDFSNPAVYLNIFATATFLLDSVFYFFDWYLQLYEMGATSLYVDDRMPNKVFFARIPNILSGYYFYNNLFFMAAAILYLMQAVWPAYTALHM